MFFLAVVKFSTQPEKLHISYLRETENKNLMYIAMY